MAKDMDSFFSLFDVASAQEVPFGISQYIQYYIFFVDSSVSSFVFHSALLTMKSVDFVVEQDGFLCKTESLIVCIFHRDYFDNRGAFKKFVICTAVYNRSNLADNNGCFIFQTIIDGYSTIN